MKKTRWLRMMSLGLVSVVALGALTLGQTSGSSTDQTPSNSGQNQRPVDLFGGGAYPGGYLKYTYAVAREGNSRTSTTTTEITPQADGMYAVVSTSSETLPLDMVHVGFFGIPLMGHSRFQTSGHGVRITSWNVIAIQKQQSQAQITRKGNR